MKCQLLFLIVIFFISGCAGEDAPENAYLFLDFENGSPGLSATVETVNIETVKDRSVPAKGKHILQASGSYHDVDSAAEMTRTLPMQPREFYRLSAWIKIGSSSPDNQAPRIACIFETDTEGTRLGRGMTEAYDMTKPGTWQLLTGEFRVPWGTVNGRIAIVPPKWTKTAVAAEKSVDIAVDNITLERIPHYSIDDLYRFDPVPPQLEAVRGIHPRLYITDARIAELKRQITTTHKHLFDEFIAQTNGILRHEPPKYMDESEWANIEQLYMRGVGNNMPYLALAYVLTGEQRYLEGAKTWALAACGYPTWGLHEFANADLSTGHQLYGLAIVYDWLYHDLDEATKTTIRDTMIGKCSYLFDAAAKGIIVDDDEAYMKHPWPEWDEAYLQNHLWINSCGLGTAGLAIFDEYEEALRWPAFTVDRYKRTQAVLGSDGASHEGPGYWSYGADWMLKFMELSRDLLGINMYGHPWWGNTWRYRMYMSLPKNSWTYDNTTVDVGDSRRFDWYGPDYMLRRLASEFDNGHAQWLADALDTMNAEHPVDRWLNLLWYDPSVKPVPPDELPTMYRFDDIDILSARSDWSGDGSFLFFKCGPYVGHHAIREFNYCPSSAHHVHPDTGNFMVFGNGEWLIRDDGYRAKWAAYHNTLLVGNGEQLGGGYPIFNGVEPHAVRAEPTISCAFSSPDMDQITGEVTEAYPESSGLKRFRRHLLYVKPDILIIVDDIELENSDDLELRFHPEQQEADFDGSAFTAKGKKAILRLEPLTAEGLDINAETLMALPKEELDKSIPLYTIRLRNNAAKWRNAVALSWSSANATPATVKLSRDGDIWRFSASKKTVSFDWQSGQASLVK